MYAATEVVMAVEGDRPALPKGGGLQLVYRTPNETHDTYLRIEADPAGDGR